MPAATLQQTVRKLRRLAALEVRSVDDHELLARYIDSKDEQAFASLVDRHAAVVLGVCRRVLAHNQDAEDACQAVFLVLARKADSIRKRQSLRCWLHGVAFRVASRLLRQKLRRRSTTLSDPPAPQVDLTWREVQGILDAELVRLPEVLRLPLILCYLEGKTRDEAAAELGWTASTFRGRLERGREKLRKRLEARGIGLSAGLLAILITGTGLASVPAHLLDSLSQLPATGASHAGIRTLAQGALPAVLPRILAWSLALLAGVAACVIGLSAMSRNAATPAFSAAAYSADPNPKKEEPAQPLDDKELEQTAARCRAAAIEWLKKNQGKDGSWDQSESPAISWKGGPTALAVMALARSGMKADDAVLARALRYLRELKPSQTYVVALQTMALCQINDRRDAAQIAANVEWLTAAAWMPGDDDLRGWSYTKTPGERTDGSNTQFALLALHEASRAGFKPKNRKFWEAVRAMYLSRQLVDGGWPYSTTGNSTFSMTASGLCGLLEADDQIGNDTRETRKARERALVLLARKYNPFAGTSVLYNLHLLARLGKLTGERKIGDHDWYAEGVEWILKHQNADGSVSSSNPIDRIKPLATAWAILVLTR